MEFIATKEAIETLLKNGAVYIPTECPQYGINFLRWADISPELVNVPKHIKHINTMDTFLFFGVEMHPIKNA